ncbi:MAG: NUDIX domain-containing protein [Planctomycetota bacterium]
MTKARPKSTSAKPPLRATSPCDVASAAARDHEIRTRLTRWFAAGARALPWRTAPRDPWRSLVSEFMLQQTQVSRVLDHFEPFIVRFPSPKAMASAPESAVLAAWSGLGYYRRARMLHQAAREIVDRFDATVPQSVEELRTLPGIGRYTAGAIASIVFGHAAPIVDGNVSRVLLRIEGREESALQATDWTWKRSTDLIKGVPSPRRNAPLFNEGLMELGATVCTPKAPRCDACPLATLCAAKAAGSQERIPTPKVPAKKSAIVCDVVVVRDADGRLLIEQRPAKGLWAAMWQAPTRERHLPKSPRPSNNRRSAATAPLFEMPLPALLTDLGLGRVVVVDDQPTEFDHQTTHRDVRFRVWQGLAAKPLARGKDPIRKWATRVEVASMAISNAQRRILLSES